MPMFQCSCGKKHREYATVLKCEATKSRTACACPGHWKAKRAESDPKRRWNSHSPDCPLREAM